MRKNHRLDLLDTVYRVRLKTHSYQCIIINDNVYLTVQSYAGETSLSTSIREAMAPTDLSPEFGTSFLADEKVDIIERYYAKHLAKFKAPITILTFPYDIVGWAAYFTDDLSCAQILHLSVRTPMDTIVTKFPGMPYADLLDMFIRHSITKKASNAS